MMEGKKYNPIKFLGMAAAIGLIAFGSLNNFWRTINLAWNKIKERRS